MYTVKNSSILYVSQKNGDDKCYNGLAPTPDKYGNGPFRSLDPVLSMVRAMRALGDLRPMTVAFTDDYYIKDTITLDEGLCGLTFESFGDRKRIIGGSPIVGWTRDSYRGVDCLSAPMPAGLPFFTDLFVDGKRASVTRYPKEGLLKVIATEEKREGGHFPSAHMSGSSKWFTVDKSDLAKVDNVEDAMINYYHYWIDEHSPIESYDRESGRLVMEYRSRFSATSGYEQNDHGAVYYYLTGVPNTFAAPGEWYLDRHVGRVYYIPRDESETPDSIEVMAPTVDRLIRIEGEDIVLRDLEIFCGVGDYASKLGEKYSAIIPNTTEDTKCGSDIQSVCSAPGAVVLENSSRCGIRDCHIHGVGVHGVEIGSGCCDIRIENNRIEDICAGGIKIVGEPESEEAKVTRNCTIRGNTICHCGIRYAAGCGILSMHTSCNEISDNEIFDLEYSGISDGWVWGYSETATFGNIIRGNHIHHIGKGNLSDMGGIYLLGKHRGTVIADNRIHDVKARDYGAWGIYLDEGSSYVTVEGNAVYNTQNECIHIHYGSGNVVKNNIFYSADSPCVYTTRHELHDQILFERNIFVTGDSPIYSHRHGTPDLESRCNVLWSLDKGEPDGFLSSKGEVFSLSEWQSVFGREKGSTVADPMIADLEGFDFTLLPDSPALELGFKPLPEKTARG
jgi:parallel beta-helix repeat protein